VLRLVARGLSNKQIATELTISSKTVANHVEHIYAKIDASTRARQSVRDAARPAPRGAVRDPSGIRQDESNASCDSARTDLR
jgi:hypothetical protein